MAPPPFPPSTLPEGEARERKDGDRCMVHPAGVVRVVSLRVVQEEGPRDLEPLAPEGLGDP